MISYLYKQGETTPVVRYSDVQIGYYLSVPVIVVEDRGDGWVQALWPDQEKPRKHKPFTYKKQEKWLLWKDQVKVAFEL